MNLSETESFSFDILQESICFQHSVFYYILSAFLPAMQTVLENTNFPFLKGKTVQPSTETGTTKSMQDKMLRAQVLLMQVLTTWYSP